MGYPIFCCQFVARIAGLVSQENHFCLPVSGLIGTNSGNQIFSFERSQCARNRALRLACLGDECRVVHVGIVAQVGKYGLFQTCILSIIRPSA